MSARNIAIGVAVLAVLAIGGYYLMNKGGKKPAEAVESATPASADSALGAAELASDAAAPREEPSDAGDTSATDTPPEEPSVMTDAAGDVPPDPYDAIEPADEDLIDSGEGSGDVFEATEDDLIADGEPIEDDAAGSGHGEDEPAEEPETKPND